MTARLFCLLFILLAGLGAKAAEEDSAVTPAEPETPGETTAAASTNDADDDTAGAEDIPEGLTRPSDDNFIPSVQISEDLSVSFPTDI